MTDKTWFEKNFIDPELYFLKDDVQERLERFPWLCGPYGVTGRNKKYPFVHLFVTVKRRKSFTKSQVRKDIETEFGKEALKFVELIRGPKKPPNFRFMGGKVSRCCKGSHPMRPSPGGGISVDSRDESNPLQTSEQRQFLQRDRNASGTLMLFGVSNRRHYALTCYHVACDNDSVRFSDAFQDNPRRRFEEISADAANEHSATRTRSFLYHNRGDQMNERNNNERVAFEVDDVALGKFAEGYYEAKCDIASIKIRHCLQVDCNMGKTNYPCDRDYIMNKFRQGKPIQVEKDGYASEQTTGYLFHFGNYVDDQGCKLCEKAFFVERDSSGAQPFLEPGDSGSLVCFCSQSGDDQKKYALAYGVAEVEGSRLPACDCSGDNSSDCSGDNSSDWSSGNSSDKRGGNNNAGRSDDSSDCSIEFIDNDLISRDSSDGRRDYSREWSSDNSNDKRGGNTNAESSDDSSDWSNDDTSDRSDDDGHNQGSVQHGNVVDNEVDSSSARTSGHGRKVYVCLDLQTALEKIGLKKLCIGTCNRS